MKHISIINKLTEMGAKIEEGKNDQWSATYGTALIEWSVSSYPAGSVSSFYTKHKKDTEMTGCAGQEHSNLDHLNQDPFIINAK